MKNSIIVIVLVLWMCVPAFAGPTLNLGKATVSGTTISFPVTLANIQDTPISGIDAYITFNSDVFAIKMSGNALVSATAGAATIAAGKNIIQSIENNALHLLVIGINDTAIPDGVIAQISFNIISSSISNSDYFAIIPLATDPDGSPISPALISSETPAPATHQLTITSTGNGSGKFRSTPPCSTCTDSAYSASFYDGTNVAITPTPDSGSSFELWYGDCSGSGNCAVTMIGNRSATATFTLNNTVLVNTNYDSRLSDAYGKAANKAVIQTMGVTFFEDLNLSRDIAVTIKGGYETLFKNQVGYSVIDGGLTISKGSLVAERLLVR